MKPIEVGCLALVIRSVHSANIGKTVRVLFRCEDGDWKVETTAEPLIVGFLARESETAECSEQFLMRIDDYDASADATEQEREVEHG